MMVMVMHSDDEGGGENDGNDDGNGDALIERRCRRGMEARLNIFF